MTPKRWVGVAICLFAMAANTALGDVVSVSVWSAAVVIIIMTSPSQSKEKP